MPLRRPSEKTATTGGLVNDPERITLNWFERAAIRSIARKRVHARMLAERQADLAKMQHVVRELRAEVERIEGTYR